MRTLSTLALALLVPIAVSAQGALRTLTGRVVRLSGSATQPVAGAWVTLHRVGPDRSSPLDSMRSGKAGEFRFDFRPAGDTSAVYFAATQYAGIAYFTAPGRASATRLGGEISVFDTTSALVPLSITSRHIIVAAPDTGDGRDVLELFVVSNSGDRTLVTSRARQSTFEIPLPPRAIDPRVAEGDVPAEAMTFGGGVARVSAPLAPGTKRISFTYRLPANTEPIAIAPSGAADLVEVLVEDAEASVTGAGLKEEAPTSADGRTFRRFTGEKFAGGAAISIVAPSGTTRSLPVVGGLVVAAALVMGGALVASARRP
jgi:hypothetical protein